ncbi:hypothetical protein [Pseudoxanthomonas sp. USHLN014]|uniref:hypothetical protein n=1 Tax=Pseudoxanthomonas sp. USHLN014 TaxID=3081297 RepID=UPI00301BC2B6
MQQCTTQKNAPQPGAFPSVSHRLLVVLHARRDALRHGVNPRPAEQAAAQAYRASRGNRFYARRMAWAAVDAQCGRGEVA